MTEHPEHACANFSPSCANFWAVYAHSLCIRANFWAVHALGRAIFGLFKFPGCVRVCMLYFGSVVGIRNQFCTFQNLFPFNFCSFLMLRHQSSISKYSLHHNSHDTNFRDRVDSSLFKKSSRGFVLRCLIREGVWEKM